MNKDCKRYLISANQLQHLQSKNMEPQKIHHPNLVSAMENKKSIQETLSNPDISDFDKVLIHAGNLQKMLNNLRDTLTIPKANAILGDVLPTSQMDITMEQVENKHPVLKSPSTNKVIDHSTISTHSNAPDQKKKKRSQESIERSKKNRSSLLEQKRNQTVKEKSLTPPSSPRFFVGKINRSQRPKRIVSQKFNAANVIKQIPPGLRPRAVANLKKISAHPDIRWNASTGFVHIGKNLLPDTNITSLVDDLSSGESNFAQKALVTRVKKLISKKL